MDDQKNNTNNNNLNDFIQDDEEELSSGEYLGTFRWKKKLSFPKLIFVNDRLDQSYYGINKWADFFEKRINFEVEPHIIDALSYPLTIINSLLELQKVYLNFSLIYEKTINLIFIGASKKCEERIAIGSNYFDEIYYFLLSIRSLKIPNINDNHFNLNLHFVGEEVSQNASYTSSIKNIKYTFHKQTFGNFLKDYALELSKSNTLIFGLNTGFGAGFLKLTLNWINDLIKLLKFNYIFVFSYTNDYEDMIGEFSIFEEILKSNFLFKIKDNNFKSMTTYQGENETWSCGNYGFYAIQGSKNIPSLNEFAKLKSADISKKLKEIFEIKKIIIK